MTPQRLKKPLKGLQHSMVNDDHAIRRVFVRDFEALAEIGVYDHEKGYRQRVRINIDLSVHENLKHHGDHIENVVCYNQIVKGVENIIAQGHINLVETLAEKIAEMSLENQQVIRSRVRVEKLEAIKAALSVGVEIERFQSTD